MPNAKTTIDQNGIKRTDLGDGTVVTSVEYDHNKTGNALIEEYNRYGTVGGRKVDDDLASETSPDATKPNGSFTPQKLDGNIKDGTASPDGVLKSVNFEPEPNIMGELFQSTYHFSFYLDTDIETEQGKGNEFVIAETGMTGMNIQNVEIEASVGPTFRTRNANATSITIKIFEPFGAQFPDLLYQAAVKMNIRNYLKAPWFLRLKLHGYDTNGTKVTIGEEWKWKMVLIDVQSNISENGSLHTITAMPQAEVALNNQYCMLPTIVNTTGSTVGEVLQNVVTSMNQNVTRTYGPTNPPVLEFAIEDRAYPYDTKVGISKPFDHKIVSDAPQDSNTRTAERFGTQTTQFSPGTDIPNVVDMLMARTDTAIQAARISREKPATSGPDLETTVRDPASLMHRVDTKVEFLGYNAIIGDYCKKITFVVKPYQTLRLLTSMGRAMSFDREKTLNKQKAQHAVQKNLMRKQYDYLFTGMNTEVEKFDINVNFRWAVQVPVIQGWGTNTGSTARVDIAAQAQSHVQELGQNKSQVDAKMQERLALQTELDKTPGQITEAQSSQRTKLNDELNVLKARGVQLQTIAAQEQDQFNAEANAKADARRKANPILGRVVDGEDDIYEIAQGKSDGSATEGFGGAGTGDTSYLPITIVQDPDVPTANVATGTSTDNNANKSIYGALLNQMYGTMDGNLQSLELDVRGDPYWLGPGSNGTLYDEDSTGVKPNFNNGEHMFVFRFKLPQGYDQTTGTISVESDNHSVGGSKGAGEEKKPASGGHSNIFTGFYSTVSVTHHFREGYFSQTLNAVRIQGWSYENIIEGRENTVEDNTIYSDTKAPVVSNPSAGSEANTSGNRGAGDRPPNPTGSARGIRNNNPGNLRATPFAKRQPGYTGSDDQNFAQFSSMDAGVRAQETLILHNYVQSPTTVTAVIDRYLGKNVPGNINSQASKTNYINYVTRQVGKSNVGPGDAAAVAAAMRNFENGTR